MIGGIPNRPLYFSQKDIIAQDGIAIMDHNVEDAHIRLSRAPEVLRVGEPRPIDATHHFNGVEVKNATWEQQMGNQFSMGNRPNLETTSAKDIGNWKANIAMSIAFGPSSVAGFRRCALEAMTNPQEKCMFCS